MNIYTVLFHLLLSVVLFFLLGWIGRHSTGMGYISLSLFVTRDEAPAFNFSYRVLAPLVFLVIASALLYAFGLDCLVDEIWMVVLFYAVLRVGYHLFMGRRLLINWPREALILLGAISGSWFLYDEVIRTRQNLLPDPQTVSSELWIIVSLFIYTILNNIDLPSKKSKKRKNDYLENRYCNFKQKYGDIINKSTPDQMAESIVYTVLIYEDFQRPRAIRLLERAAFPWFSSTIGPMQIQTDESISDAETVEAGAQKLSRAYISAKQEIKDKEGKVDLSRSQHRREVLKSCAADYNKDDNYVSDIRQLNIKIINKFYQSIDQDTYHFDEQYSIDN